MKSVRATGDRDGTYAVLRSRVETIEEQRKMETCFNSLNGLKSLKKYIFKKHYVYKNTAVCEMYNVTV